MPAIRIIEMLSHDQSATATDEMVEQHEKVMKAQQTIFDRLFIDAATIHPVMSGWIQLTEAAMTMKSDQTMELASGHSALINLVRNLARKDLDADGVAYPEIKI